MTAEQQGGQQGIWKVGRGDYVAAGIGVIVVMAVGVVALLAPSALAWATGDPLTVVSQANEVGPAAQLNPVPGVTVTYGSEVVWSLSQAKPWQWLVSMIPNVLTVIALVVGAAVVLDAVNNARLGRPFDRRTVRDIRVLGFTVTGYAIIVPIASVTVGFVLVVGSNQDLAINLLVDPMPVVIFVVGLLLVLLGDVLRRGARLQDDVDGLV